MKQVLKRVLAGCLALCLLAIPFSVSAEKILYDYPAEGEDTVTAPSAMMLYLGVKPEQDVILYEKEADNRYQPGSLMRVAMAGYAMKLITEQQLDM